MKRLIESMANYQKALGGLLLAICLVFITVYLFLGYVGIQLPWVKNAALYAMIWGIFAESGVLVYERSHFSFTVLCGRIKNKKVTAIWEKCILMIKFLFAALITFFGFKLSMETGNGTKAEFLMDGYIWLCLPFFGITSMIYLFYHISENRSTSGKEGESL
ncbi:MAG: TRAP transporter small permease subunit [Clostridium sp.]